MALIKEYKLESIGITASYWRVGMLTIDTASKEVNFSFNLYTSKDAKSFVHKHCVTELMGIEDKTLYEEYFGSGKGTKYKDWQTACYEYAKKYVPFFKDAIDDPEELQTNQTMT